MPPALRVAAAALALFLAGCLAPAAPAPDAASAPAAAFACAAPCKVEVAPPRFATREPHLAVDPTDPEHLVAASMTFDTVADAAGRLHLQVHESLDGGATWTTAPFALAGATPAGETYNAQVAFLADGTRVLAGVAVEGAYSPLGPVQGRSAVFVEAGGATTLLDEGRGAENAFAGVAMRGFDKPSFAVGDGLVAAAWTVRDRVGPDAAMALALATSPDARDWTRREPPALARDVVSGPGAVVGDVVAFPVATFAGRDAVAALDFDCALVVSEDGGASWSARPLGACTWVPALAAHGGELVLALPVEGGILLRRSSDLGATWTDGPRLDADGATVPSLAALPDGRAVVTHFAALADGRTAYRAALVDGDVVQTLVLDAALAREPRFLGNVFGLATVPGGAVAVWITEKDDTTQVAAARLRTG